MEDLNPTVKTDEIAVVIATDPDTDTSKTENPEIHKPKENEDESEKEVDVTIKDEENEDEDDEKKDTEKPLLDEDSVKIDIKSDGEGEDTPTLPLPDKKKVKDQENEDTIVTDKKKDKLPKYLFPISNMKDAWNNSTNVAQFLGRATCIIFQTVGWFTCVGGVPLISLVMLIIGCIYVGDCAAEPNIPVYLIVAGVFGTIQHVMAIWLKYVPRNSEGRLKVYRAYCSSINGLFHLFLMIWFILGCIWVYSISDYVEFQDKEKDEYCNKTVFYFAFWILNLSFILIALLIVLSICFIVCIIATPKEQEQGIVQP